MTEAQSPDLLERQGTAMENLETQTNLWYFKVLGDFWRTKSLVSLEMSLLGSWKCLSSVKFLTPVWRTYDMESIWWLTVQGKQQEIRLQLLFVHLSSITPPVSENLSSLGGSLSWHLYLSWSRNATADPSSGDMTFEQSCKQRMWGKITPRESLVSRLVRMIV
jgi:hypothetical protein